MADNVDEVVDNNRFSGGVQLSMYSYDEPEWVCYQRSHE